MQEIAVCSYNYFKLVFCAKWTHSGVLILSHLLYSSYSACSHLHSLCKDNWSWSISHHCSWCTGRHCPWAHRCSQHCHTSRSSRPAAVHWGSQGSLSSWSAAPQERLLHWKPNRTHTDPDFSPTWNKSVYCTLQQLTLSSEVKMGVYLCTCTCTLLTDCTLPYTLTAPKTKKRERWEEEVLWEDEGILAIGRKGKRKEDWKDLKLD